MMMSCLTSPAKLGVVATAAAERVADLVVVAEKVVAGERVADQLAVAERAAEFAVLALATLSGCSTA
jgi:hypothetical protein